MRCARHPGVETALTCGKCGQAICPQCLVQTPVGARCPQCAKLKRLPVFEVGSIHYLKAAGVSLGLALLFGFLWALILSLIPFLYLSLILALAIGYGIGEGVSLSVNRKRGHGLQALAACGVLISYLIANFRFLHGVVLFPISALFDLWGLIALALGVLVAVRRLR